MAVFAFPDKAWLNVLDKPGYSVDKRLKQKS